MSEINPGDVIRLKTDPPFTDEANAPADPDQVRCIVRRVGQPPITFDDTTNPAVTKDGTGVYHLDYLIPRAGKYFYRWEGTGGLTAAEENTFTAVTHF